MLKEDLNGERHDIPKLSHRRSINSNQSKINVSAMIDSVDINDNFLSMLAKNEGGLTERGREGAANNSA